mmetsp:Transcript_102782/g.291199  ORF Transcript_102782/g.291199 Transcript_102782/m.291199 type:complete len:389 (-) Transcript_102782:740-1906(-)
MLNLDALRCPGRAAGEEHVHDPLARLLPRPRLLRALCGPVARQTRGNGADLQELLVRDDRSASAAIHCAQLHHGPRQGASFESFWRYFVEKLLHRHHCLGLHLLQDPEDPPAGVVRLERNIRAASHQHAVDRHEHENAALEEEWHHLIESDAELIRQHAAQVLAHGVEFPVGVLHSGAVLQAVHKSPVVGPLLGLLGEQDVYLPRLELTVVRLIAPLGHLSVLLLAHGWYLRQRHCQAVLLLAHGGEQHSELVLEIPRALHAEKILPEQQLQCHLLRLALRLAPGRLHPQLQGQGGRALVDHVHSPQQLLLLGDRWGNHVRGLEDGVAGLISHAEAQCPREDSEVERAVGCLLGAQPLQLLEDAPEEAAGGVRRLLSRLCPHDHRDQA